MTCVIGPILWLLPYSILLLIDQNIVMKRILCLSMGLVFVLCAAGVQAQPTKKEMWVKIATDLQRRLGLTDEQTANLRKEALLHLDRRDSVNALRSSSAEKLVMLKKIGQVFENSIHVILSDQQWAAYRAMQDSATEAMRKRLAAEADKRKH